MTIQEIDFQLIENKAEAKIFRFTDAEGAVYNMVGSSAICKLYLTATPTDIVCTINEVAGTITVPFTTTHSANLGTFEYIIEETKSGGAIIPLVKGNIAVLQYIPFSESIEAYLRSELPANLTLTMDFQNQRIMYWRRILQGAFEITDEDINTESAWPTLVNALLAKLVVHDALELSLKGSYVQFLGGDYTSTETVGGGGVKSVETGPTKVEYYDTATAAKSATASSSGSQSTYEILKESVCGLANFLRVKLPMCLQDKHPVSPIYHQNSSWEGTQLPDL